MNEKTVATIISIVIVGSLCCASVAAVDYFADGCMVDYETVITRKQPDGSFISYNGTTCHQMLIHTAAGRRRQTE